MAYIGVDELGFRTGFTQLGGKCIAGFVVAARHDDFRTTLCEGGGGCTGDAGQGTSDENDWRSHDLFPFEMAEGSCLA